MDNILRALLRDFSTNRDEVSALRFANAYLRSLEGGAPDVATKEELAALQTSLLKAKIKLAFDLMLPKIVSKEKTVIADKISEALYKNMSKEFSKQVPRMVLGVIKELDIPLPEEHQHLLEEIERQVIWDLRDSSTLPAMISNVLNPDAYYDYDVPFPTFQELVGRSLTTRVDDRHPRPEVRGAYYLHINQPLAERPEVGFSLILYQPHGTPPVLYPARVRGQPEANESDTLTGLMELSLLGQPYALSSFFRAALTRIRDELEMNERSELD